jgi:lactate 2-monooxygenase
MESKNNSDDRQMNIYQSEDDGAKLLPISFEEWEDRAKKIVE